VTTGEWGAALRAVYGEYRAPTGVGKAARADVDDLAEVRADVDAVSAKMGRRLKMLVGKPGLDGHSNGAEQIAVRARDCGMEVVYEGIRLTPAEIVNAAIEEDVHIVGLSILSGSHVALMRDVMDRLRKEGRTIFLSSSAASSRRKMKQRSRPWALRRSTRPKTLK
jgi:(2R)-ethylmalonyl-CoA mutase